MKRNLTLFEEKIIRLHHHEFGNLSIKRTAKKLQVSPSTIYRYLRAIKRKAPNLFSVQPVCGKRRGVKIIHFEDYMTDQIIQKF